MTLGNYPEFGLEGKEVERRSQRERERLYKTMTIFQELICPHRLISRL